MPANRVVAIGGSAGGVEAVSRILAGLPPRFPAAVLVTIHVASSTSSVLPSILDRAGPLAAGPARDGETLEPGRVYVAVPDRHLVVRDGRLWNERGPREHHSRPAIDPMFRSLVGGDGASPVAVVVTGALDDGTAGLIAVKQAGGVAIVQDPESALHRGMPASAVANVDVDAIVPLDEIAALLVSIVGVPPPEGGGVEEGPGEPDDVVAPHPHPSPGATPSAYSCPECGGVLWEAAESGFVRYRCRVGHGYTSETLHVDQGEVVEQALWAALRALEERVALSRRMAASARERGHVHTAARFDESAGDAERRARVLNGLLLKPGVHEPADG